MHCDLSAYNSLYGQGLIVLIYLPQVADLQSNRQAQCILLRDISRCCEYFIRQGVGCH